MKYVAFAERKFKKRGTITKHSLATDTTAETDTDIDTHTDANTVTVTAVAAFIALVAAIEGVALAVGVGVGVGLGVATTPLRVGLLLLQPAACHTPPTAHRLHRHSNLHSHTHI